MLAVTMETAITLHPAYLT